ncbi:hypothetical protein K3495_g2629 [Podosphaera aphanis]|nr:hypothetical protein K3495_g2629 [Podosphaera aphanis]
MAAPIPTDRPSTVSRISRVTKGGRRLTYVLTVIQQPERARACGSGAKSSSDRRPVDPPPVVDLKIYNEDGEEITFAYEANFFLFVTLDTASPAVRNRNHQAAPASNPVLTGMPVSGMAYLDRPTEAGYFIFPDLSVRHEGQYVLCFNLYEECKNDCDRDNDQKCFMSEEPGAPDSSFDWRMEVKSVPFTVYSAKKFPGLTESTHLSRIVAEQGCRVRIRRDARMRRRDQKMELQASHEDYSRYQEEDIYHDRTRSCSFGGSTHSTSAPHLEPSCGISETPSQNHQRYTPTGQGHGGCLPFIDRQNSSGNSPSFTHLTLPRPIQPPAQPSPFHFSKVPSKYCFDNRTETRRHFSHILNPSHEPQDYETNPRRTSTPSYSQPSSGQNFVKTIMRHKSPPSYHSYSPSSPKTGPLTVTEDISPRKNFLPLPKPCSPIERNISGHMSNRDRSPFALACNSPSQLENCLPPLNKRPLETALPSISSMTDARLFNGSRPLSSELYHTRQKDELARRRDCMTYKRASGAVRVRGPPLFS